jgi:uncharacterized protein (TIGR03435 family)
MRLHVAALVMFGVLQQPLQFEVASVKPTKSLSGVSGGCRGRDVHLAPTDVRMAIPLGRCVITAGRLTHIMAIAYRIDVNRIGGRPDWEGPNRYDIEAKAESTSATQQQLLQMLQALLADRFKLKAHLDTKQEDGYALVIAKNGPKLTEARSTDESRLLVSGGKINKADAANGKNLNLNTVIGSNTSMHEFVEVLSRSVQAEVVDKTGLTGFYNFKLSWEPDESVSSVLQQQLGLRLERQKVPVDYMTIDSAEKPSDN